jgi:DNA-binding CsgD family transcriptional regulator
MSSGPLPEHTGPGSAPDQVPLLDALDEVLAWSTTPPPSARAVVCRLATRLAGAPAAGHVRYRPTERTVSITVWRAETGGRAESVVPVEGTQPRDWWTPSAARSQLLSDLDQRYLAELPLDRDPAHPSLVVVGRGWPFEARESGAIARARRALRTVERLIERLEQQGGPVPSADPVPRLTVRELQVLEMLGEGLLARSIAQRLMVSERTVHKHLGSVYRKLDAHDRLLAVRRAEMLGLLAPPTEHAPIAAAGRAGW